MIENVKPVDALLVGDLQAHPVWQYTNREGGDETLVRPVTRVPVASLNGRVVGTQVVLASGQRVWALIGNVDPTSPRMTEHFLTLSVERDARWFTLARYHDPDRDENGPHALARYLGLSINEVFPINYDIRQYFRGEAAALSGCIQEEPRERPSRTEIIGMAVP